MTPDFYGLPHHIAEIEATLARASQQDAVGAVSSRGGEGLSRASLLAELAWYLRQRDTRRAIAQADECETLLSRAKAEKRWPSVVGRLSLVRGEAARLFSRFDEALYYLATGRDHFRQNGDALGLGDALILMAGVHGDRGELETQHTLLEEAEHAFAQIQNPLRLAFVRSARGLSGSVAAPEDMDTPDPSGLQVMAGDPTQHCVHPALMASEMARDAYKAFGHGQAKEAAEIAAKAVQVSMDGGRVRLAVAMASLAAVSHAALYDGVQATVWMERSLSLSQEAEWPWGVAIAIVRSAWVLQRLGLPDAALDLLAEAEGTIALLGRSRITALADCAKGDALLALGKVYESSEFFSRALRWAGTRDVEAIRHHALVGQARACMEDSDFAAALRHGTESQRVAEDMGSPIAQLESLDILLSVTHGYRDGGLSDAGFDALLEASQATTWASQAQALIEGEADVAPPPSLLSSLARLASEDGDYRRAYVWERRATQIKKRLEAGRTRGRAATLSARRRSEQAQKELNALRHSAEMESARADALSHMLHTLERLSSVGQEILAHLDSAGIISTVARCGKNLLGKDSGYTVYLSDGSDKPLAPYGADGKRVIAAPPCELELWSDEDGELTQALEKVQRERFETILISPEGVRQGMILCPLISGESSKGVLAITSRTAFDDHRRAIARSLALFASNALVNAERTEALAEANETLERIANYDALTDIPNRRYFTETATTEFLRAIRHHRALTVMMLDIDFFKKVNDTYGHAAGDLVLAQVADTLASGVRPGDMVGRLGGEEFAILLPDCDLTAGALTADRLRKAVEALVITHDDQVLRVTTSVGLSQVDGDDKSIEQALQRADSALYTAKRGGRNRVESLLA